MSKGVGTYCNYFRRIYYGCHALKMAARQPSGPPLEDEFRNASEVMRNAKGLRLSSEQKLTIYALFKQVSP